MQTVRDIQRRIRSVKNTQKITRAMKMVSAAKLRRAQEMAEAARPFFDKTLQILRAVGAKTRDDLHPLLRQERHSGRSGFIVITADRGLCGGYNARVIELAKNNIDKAEKAAIIAAGKKGRDFFKKRGYEVVADYIDIEDRPSFDTAQKIARKVIDLFTGFYFDQVQLAYTEFHSALTQRAKIITLLPVAGDEVIESEVPRTEYLFEPSPGEVLDLILPKYVENILYGVLLESKASEFGARMTAMDSATENAEEMIDELTLSYNRARQAEITTEISEIVGGAEALE